MQDDDGEWCWVHKGTTIKASAVIWPSGGCWGSLSTMCTVSVHDLLLILDSDDSDDSVSTQHLHTYLHTYNEKMILWRPCHVIRSLVWDVNDPHLRSGQVLPADDVHMVLIFGDLDTTTATTEVYFIYGSSHSYSQSFNGFKWDAHPDGCHKSALKSCRKHRDGPFLEP